MFCSTIIPTIGRPTLARAVNSVLDQEFTADDFEVIVVNDSAQRLPESDWQQSERIQVITTQRRERSVARNTGAAIARGKYLHFLDDDDWMLPGAFATLWKLANNNQAAWLYGGYRLVDSAGNPLKEYRPDESGNCFIRFIAGEWLPLQVSLIKSEAFNAVGGFAPLGSLLGGDEDVDLSRQIALCNDIAGTSDLVATIRFGVEDSTTNYADLRAQSRQSREKALSAPGAFARMLSSADSRKSNASYWYGRIVWTYLTSVVWNLQHRNLMTAASRMIQGTASLAYARRHFLSYSFWRGTTRPHAATKGWLCSEI